MIIDANLTLSGSWANGVWTPQSIVGTGNIISTNVVDTGPDAIGGNQPNDWGSGEGLRVAFELPTAVAGATSVEFQLVSADDAAISVNTQILNSTGAIAIASLTAGKQFTLHMDRSAPYVARRYVAVRYVIVGTSTTGTVIANIVKDYQDVQNNVYKSGFVVL